MEVTGPPVAAQSFITIGTRKVRAASETTVRLSESQTMLSLMKQRQVISEWNNTRTSYPRDKCVHEVFELQEQSTPDALAVVFAGQQLTYAELNKRSNQLAHYLRGTGIGPGVLAGVCMERSAEAVIALLAILKAGGAYLPLDPTYPIERLSLMTSDAQALLLLTNRGVVDSLPRNEARVLVLDELQDIIQQQSAGNPVNLTTSEDLAYVIYTSGSTGPPKGICVPHRAINRLVLNTNYIQLCPDDRVAQASNTSFDAATFEIWGALLNGACVVGLPRDSILSPRLLVSALQEQSISVLFLTTALFNQVARETPGGFASLRDVLFGGEAVDPQVVKRVLEHGPPRRLLHVYGPTESTTFSSWYLVEEVSENARTIPIGRPISNTEIFVLDEDLRQVAMGKEGELYIGGEGLAHGYLDRPESTAEKFIPNPFDPDNQSRLYKTGDMGRLLSDGNIEFVGRVDNQVKVRGFRIELEEIEAVLTRHPKLREAVVLVQKDCNSDKSLVAYVVPRTGEAPSLSELRSHLKQHLPDYMMPARFALVETLPLTANGKIDRAALATVAALRPKLDAPYVQPMEGLEKIIANVWREVLQVQKLGIHDNFFELGGHSLNIAQVHTKLEKLTGIETPVTTMFQYPTISSLARYLSGTSSRSGTFSALDPIRERARKQRIAFSQRKRGSRKN